jgi:hypothetical protein
MTDITPSAFPAGRWRARWIWFEPPQIASRGGFVLNREAAQTGRFGCLRRRFALQRVPDCLPARVSADSRYVLWVNGAEVARGPVRGNPRKLRYDLVDLAPQLREGENLIAVLARFYGRANPWWMPAPAAFQLGAGAFVFEARLSEDEWLVSDGRWRALPGDAWQDGETLPVSVSGTPPERFDARKLPADWREPGFDDAAWAPAIELGANAMGFSGHHEPPSQPYGAMLPRPIPQLGGVSRRAFPIGLRHGLRGQDIEDPVLQADADGEAGSARRLEDSAAGLELPGSTEGFQQLILDFGEIVAGTLILEVDAEPGARFDLSAAELLTPDGCLDRQDQYAGFRYVARSGEERFESFDALGLRYAALSIRSAQAVRFHSLSVRERLCPGQPGPAFRCNEILLEKIWQVGRRTVDLCSHDAYLDCPTREQRAWTGDFVVHQMVDLTTNADWRLARHNVELVASPRPDGMLPMAAGGDIEHIDASFIPDWALHWVRALYNLYRYTGDREFVAGHLASAENVLRWFLPYHGEDGLLGDLTGWVIVDWSSVRTDGRSSVVNALWVRALRDFAEMSTWLGDAGRSRWAARKALEVEGSFEAFWDPQRELYVDRIVDGARAKPASQHAQAAAICAGVVPPARLARLVALLTDRSRHVHATWSRAHGDAREPRPGESGVGGPYLVTGYPPPWWDVERQIVVAQPYFRYVVHEALARAGRADLVAELCLDWQALLERCATSWSETWYGGTTCHGWCSTPTSDLLTLTLGITPALPGYERARIAPRLGMLRSAQGAVPTPRGWLRVSVDRDERRLEIESPTEVEVDLDDGAPRIHPPGRRVLGLP